MKRSLLVTLLFVTTLLLTNETVAQENKLMDEFRSSTIDKINELVNENYVCVIISFL
ncbi:MAG: hypothetical protein WDO71_23375 [Bacteroidota bacterium]